jgi:hypothetical protein
VTWLPIGAAVLAGTVIRSAVLLLGGEPLTATVACVACAFGGALVALLWVRNAALPGGRSNRVRLSLVWLGLTVLLRALWLGLAIGGGWEGIALDYQPGQSQPGVLVLALVGVAPFVLDWWRRPAG